MSKIEKKKELLKLIATGKEKGFLTYEEINEALPEEVTESEELDEVMALIEENEIEIVDSAVAITKSCGYRFHVSCNARRVDNTVRVGEGGI